MKLRRLHIALALASSLLLVALLAEGYRSRRGCDDVVIVRTARSYASGTSLKWIGVGTGDGLTFRFDVKADPVVEPANPPWREDVSFAPVAVADGGSGYIAPKQAVAPSPTGRPLTSREREDYESLVGPDYQQAPRVRWYRRTSNLLAAVAAPTTRPARGGDRILAALGIRWSQAPGFVSGEEMRPGMFRETWLRIPFALPAVVLGVLPAFGVRTLFRLVARARRRRRGLCAACGYDLRGSPGLCPECGTAAPPRPAGFFPPGWDVVIFPGAIIAAGLALVVGVPLFQTLIAYDPGLEPDFSTADRWAVRGTLRTQLGDVAREVRRLREADDAAGAARLDADLRAFQARAEGAAPVTVDAPALYIVAVGDAAAVNVSPPGSATSTLTSGVVDVQVEPTGRPGVLALFSLRQVTWRLHGARQARLQNILLLGAGELEAGYGVPGVPVRKIPVPPGLFVPLMGDELSRFNQLRPRIVDLLQTKTGLSTQTFHGRYRYDGHPIIVGPSDGAWRLESLLSDLRPLHLRATEYEREHTLRSALSQRFYAPWLQRSGEPGFVWRWWVTQFDLTGPIVSAAREGLLGQTHASFDPVRRTWYAINDAAEFARLGPESAVFERFGKPAHTVISRPIQGMAFDSKRRRILLLSDGVSMNATFFTPDDEKWSPSRPLGREVYYESLTYSADDDCFYGLGKTVGADAVTVITHFGLDGVADWRIPVPVAAAYPVFPFNDWSPRQIASVGGCVAIVIPHEADPATGSYRARVILVEPKTNAVLYAGPIAPHPRIEEHGAEPDGR